MRLDLRLEAERIQLGFQMAAHAVGPDQHQRADRVQVAAPDLSPASNPDDRRGTAPAVAIGVVRCSAVAATVLAREPCPTGARHLDQAPGRRRPGRRRRPAQLVVQLAGVGLELLIEIRDDRGRVRPVGAGPIGGQPMVMVRVVAHLSSGRPDSGRETKPSSLD